MGRVCHHKGINGPRESCLPAGLPDVGQEASALNRRRARALRQHRKWIYAGEVIHQFRFAGIVPVADGAETRANPANGQGNTPR